MSIQRILLPNVIILTFQVRVSAYSLWCISTFNLIIHYFRGKFSCNFQVFRYPFDHHECVLTLRLGSTPRELVAFSNKSVSLLYSGHKELVEFRVENTSILIVDIIKNKTVFSAMEVIWYTMFYLSPFSQRNTGRTCNYYSCVKH